MDNNQEERDRLAEDEEKLQLALQEVNENEEWYDYDDVDEEEEDDEGLLIDLDAISSTTGQSSSCIVTESGPRGHFMTIDDNSQEGRGSITGINVPSQQKSDSFTAEKTLALNQALQEILENRIESTQAALEINREKQARLNDGAWADMESKKPGKGRTWGPFRTPFFKSNEADSYPPDNEDTILKRRNNELHYDSMQEHMHYNTTTKANLLHALVEDTKEVLMKPLMNRLENEIKKATTLRQAADEKGDDVQILHTRWKSMRQTHRELLEAKEADNKELVANHEDMETTQKEMAVEEEEYNRRLALRHEQDAKVAEVENELREIKRLTDPEVLSHVDSNKVDWMKVSKLWFKDSTSWVDCQKAWDFMANPKINVRPWKKDEEKRLLELVEEHQAREWDAVAQELGTNRTPFHCFYHYQNRFNPEFKSRPWKREEDAKLIEAVNRVREMASNFTWGKVAALVNSRSTSECISRYGRVAQDRNFGRWSSVEDARLIMAVETLGPNWRKVAKFMGKRTMLQCRMRYERSLNPELNFLRFTYEDDKKLLRLYKEHGRCWVRIASYFRGRTDTMIKSRFKVLEKWRMETEWWDGLDEGSKNLLLGKNLTVEERKTYEGEWKKFFNKKLGLADKDYKKQGMDKDSGLDPSLIPARPPIYLKYSKFQCGYMGRKQALYARRLEQHSQILDTLKRRFEEENPEEEDKDEEEEEVKKHSTIRDKRLAAIKTVFKNNQLKDEDLNADEQQMRDVMDNTLAEIKESGADGGGREIPADRMRQMLSALNLHFLGDSNIFVRDLLKSTTHSRKLSKLRAVAHYRKQIDLRIRRILSKNNWVFLKNRVSRLAVIPSDNRREEEIDEDRKNWDKSVPSLLMRRLGGDSWTLMKSVKEKTEKVQILKQKLRKFEDDARFKAQMAAQHRKIREVRALWHLSAEQRDKLELAANKKMKLIVSEFYKAYQLKTEILNGDIEAGERDALYIDTAERNNPLNKQNDQSCPPSSSSYSSSSSLLSSTSKSQPSKKLILSTAKDMLGDVKVVESERNDEEGEEEDVTYGSINFLPPTVATLTGLRALLLHRQQLIKKAGRLYNPLHYKRKRKRQLHIILESEDEDKQKGGRSGGGAGGNGEVYLENLDDDDDEDQGIKAKQRKLEIQLGTTSIRAIEVADGEEDAGQENEKETTDDTDAWFLKEDRPNVDKELKKRGYLPSSSFEPYYHHKRKGPNPLRRHRLEIAANAEDYHHQTPDLVTPELPPVTIEREHKSKYEIMFGPSAGNVKRMLKVNPNMLMSKPVFKVSEEADEEERGGKDIAVEDAATNKGLTDMTGQDSDVAGVKEEEKRLVPVQNLDEENIMEGARFNTVGRELIGLKGTEKETSKQLLNTVESFKKTKAAASKNDDGDVDADSDRKSIEDDLSNVVVVGLDREKGEILHFKASDVDKSAKDLAAGRGSGVAAKPIFKSHTSNQGRSNSSSRNHTTTNDNNNKAITIQTNVSVVRGRPSASFSSFSSSTPTPTPPPSSSTAAANSTTTTTTTSQPIHSQNKSAVITLAPLPSPSSQSQATTDIKEPSSSSSSIVVEWYPHQHKKKKGPTDWEVRQLASDMPHLVNNMIDRTSKMRESHNMVVVGVDPASGKVTHYNKGKKADYSASAPSSLPPPPQLPKKPEHMSEEEVKTCMNNVRQTEEYQRLMARFRALFMWPVLMSTTKPGTEVTLNDVVPCQPPEQTPKVKRPRGRPRVRPLAPGEEPVTKKKKEPEKEKEPNRPPQLKPRIDYTKVLPPSERPLRHVKRPVYHTYPSGKKPREPQSRIKRTSMLPDWWKDVISEVMVKKHEIEGGKEENYVMDISGDDDFVDKGEYSDDEWLAELREEERRKEEDEKRRLERIAAEGEVGKRKRGRKKKKRLGEGEGELKSASETNGGVLEERNEEGRGGGGGENYDNESDEEMFEENEEDEGRRRGGSIDDGRMEEMMGGVETAEEEEEGESGYSYYVTGEDGTEEQVRLEVTDD